MKRVLFNLILILSLVVPISSAHAEEVLISCPGGGSYTIIMPGGVATNGKSCTGNLTIDNRVKIIGKEAFSFSKIDSVQLTNFVVAIDANGFSYTNFKSISLGDSLENVGFEAFRFAKFENVSLPNSLKTIGECAFCDTFFTSIVLPNSLISIGRNAFARDDSRIPLKSIEIPDSVVDIGWYAFSRVGLEKLKIGKSVVEILPGAFQENKLTQIEIPSNVRWIGGYVFKNNPIEIANFSEGLIGIDFEAFAGTKIVSLVLPDSAVKIREKAFANMKNLKSVKIGNFLGIRQSDGTYTVGDIFEGSYSIEQVTYCGELKGFIVTPVCDVSKKSVDNAAADSSQGIQTTPNPKFCTREGVTVVISSQKYICVDTGSTIKFLPAAEAEKLIFDKKQMVEIFTKSGNLMGRLKSAFALANSNQLRIIIQKAIRDLDAFELFYKINEKNPFDFVGADTQLKIYDSQVTAIFKLISKQETSIICIKGKLTKKVTAVKPVCPSGYKKK